MEGALPSHLNPQRQPARQTLPRSQHVLWARDLQCLGEGACSRLGPEARTAPSTWGGGVRRGMGGFSLFPG